LVCIKINGFILYIDYLYVAGMFIGVVAVVVVEVANGERRRGR